MANLRRSLRAQPVLSAPTAKPRRWPLVAGAVLVVVLILAWFDGGEEPVHPIAQPVAVPEQG